MTGVHPSSLDPVTAWLTPLLVCLQCSYRAAAGLPGVRSGPEPVGLCLDGNCGCQPHTPHLARHPQGNNNIEHLLNLRQWKVSELEWFLSFLILLIYCK